MRAGEAARTQEEERARGGAGGGVGRVVRRGDEEGALGEELVGEELVGGLEEGDLGVVAERDALPADGWVRGAVSCDGVAGLPLDGAGLVG